MGKTKQIKVYTIKPRLLNDNIEVKPYHLEDSIKTTEMNFLFQSFLTWCEQNEIAQDISKPLNGLIKIEFWKNKDKGIEIDQVRNQLETEQKFQGDMYKFYCTSPSMLKENLGVYLRNDCAGFESWFNNIISLGHYPSKEEKVNISKDIIARVSLATTGTKRTNLVPRICIVDMYEYPYITDYYSTSLNEEGKIETVLYKAGELDGESYKHEAHDGCGLISLSYMEKIKEELGLTYTPSWIGIRQYNGLASKGVLTGFDILGYANKYNDGKTTITDVYGQEVDLKDVDIIYNTSMCKWWKHFKGVNENVYDYINQKCNEQPHLFLNNLYISKWSKEKTKDARTCYQFLQQLALSQSEMSELYKPTADALLNILKENKAYIQIAGGDMFKPNEEDTSFADMDFIKRLNTLIASDDELLGLKKVRQHVSKLALTKVKELKSGRTYIPGAHFKTLISDPISQINHILKLPQENILGVREYFVNGEEDKIKSTIARFPLNLFSEIRNIMVNNNIPDVYKEFLGHLHSDCIVFNTKDDTSKNMSGADFDLDMCYYVANNPTIYNAVVPPKDGIDYINIEDGSKAPDVLNTKENYINSVMTGRGNLIGSIALGASKIAARQQAIPYVVNGVLMDYYEIDNWVKELNELAGKEVSIHKDVIGKNGVRGKIYTGDFIKELAKNKMLIKYEDVDLEKYREYIVDQFYEHRAISMFGTGIGMKAIDAPKTGNAPTKEELKACDNGDRYPYFMIFAKENVDPIQFSKALSSNLSLMAKKLGLIFDKYQKQHDEDKWFDKELDYSISHLYRLIVNGDEVDNTYHEFINEAFKKYNDTYSDEIRALEKAGFSADKNKLRDEAVNKYIEDHPEFDDSQKILNAIVKRNTGSTFIINYFFKHLEGKIIQKYGVEPCKLGEEDIMYLGKPYKILYFNSKKSDDLEDVFTPIRLKEGGNIYIKLAEGVDVDSLIGKELPHANLVVYDGQGNKVGQYYQKALSVLKDCNVFTIVRVVERKNVTIVVEIE